MKVTARAHTNIALIKYWGKRDKKLFLPYNSSLSLTLDAFYTDTTVSFIDQKEDVFLLNGELQSKEETQKISTFIQRFRDLSSLEKKVTNPDDLPRETFTYEQLMIEWNKYSDRLTRSGIMIMSSLMGMVIPVLNGTMIRNS